MGTEMAKNTFDEMNEEKRKALNSKGGSKKKKKSIKEEMEALLKQRGTQKELCLGLLESASKGNAKSAELILKIINQFPTNKEESVVDGNDPFAD